jgi:hypothetical protein
MTNRKTRMNFARSLDGIDRHVAGPRIDVDV